MTDTEELGLFRGQLLDAIDRDLARRSRHSRLRRGSVRIGLPSLAAALAATAAVLIGLALSVAAPSSAYATARKALAATEAAGSGTITGAVTHGGTTSTLDTTRWSGDSLEMTPGDRSALGPDQAIELVDGAAYVEQPGGTWLRYASESGVGPKVGPIFELAHNNVAGTTADQILSLATGLTQSSRPDGSTVYTGTIPNLGTDRGVAASDDEILRLIGNLRDGTNAPGFHDGVQFQMTAGADGLVQQISLTYEQQDTGSPANDGTYTWTITYSGLGSTAPIAAPASSTPAPPVTWSAGPPCTTPCGG